MRELLPVGPRHVCICVPRNTKATRFIKFSRSHGNEMCSRPISHNNNFDLIRLAASAQVAVVHVVEHLKVPHEGALNFLGFLPMPISLVPAQSAAT